MEPGTSAAGHVVLPTGTEGTIYLALALHVRSHGLGEVYVGETGWDLTRPDEPRDTVLASDIAVVRAERLPLPAPRRGQTYRPIAPDLVVEIASPTQYRPDLADKAQRWLERGVRVVWVRWPDRRRGDVVPGFRLALGQLW